MMNGNAPAIAKRAWLACQLGLDRNPLRRPTDWLESCILAGLIAVLLVGTPLAAFTAGSWAHDAAVSEQRAQRSWHQVSVVVLHAAPRQAPFRHWSPPARVQARWTQGGPARTVRVPASSSARTGSRLRVWVGRSGVVAGVPMTDDEITARTIAAGILAPVGLAIVVIGLARAALWMLNRRRLAAWEAAWTRADSRWTRHG